MIRTHACCCTVLVYPYIHSHIHFYVAFTHAFTVSFLSLTVYTYTNFMVNFISLHFTPLTLYVILRTLITHSSSSHFSSTPFFASSRLSVHFSSFIFVHSLLPTFLPPSFPPFVLHCLPFPLPPSLLSLTHFTLRLSPSASLVPSPSTLSFPRPSHSPSLALTLPLFCCNPFPSPFLPPLVSPSVY